MPALLAALLAALPLILKLILYILDVTKKTPVEKRAAFLEDFDKALENAKAGSAKDLSVWFGKHL